MSNEENREDLGSALAALSAAMEDGKEDKIYMPGMDINEFEYPMEVKEFQFGNFHIEDPMAGKVGDFVAIRPVGKEHEGKTFLGIMLGDFPVSPIASYRPSTGQMRVVMKTNPAIFVPDLNKVVFGFESWWGVIKDENDLRQITDSDIQNVWYVKALKKMAEREEGGE
jgi:hypothetical protein